MFEASVWQDICGELTALLQRLLRIDTTNPPGDERACADALGEALAADGIAFEIIESAPQRANLICRLRASDSHGGNSGGGGGGGGPNDGDRGGGGSENDERATHRALLLAGHLDVVPAGELSRWKHGPFSGDLADGMIWGRGAVDMKDMVAMSAMVVKLMRRFDVPLRRDLVFAAVADEEEGCAFGSRFLVENHPDKIAAGYGIGEIGGFPQRAGRATIIPVQVAEKGICWMRMRARGEAGHGSMPRPDSAVHRLARAIARLEKPLPQRNTPAVESFVSALAAAQPAPERFVLPLLLNGTVSPLLLAKLLPPEQARLFGALLRNTVSPTMLEAGSKTNVIPDEASAILDGRLLPGQTSADLLAQLRAHLDDPGLEFEVIREAPGTVTDPHQTELWRAIDDEISDAVGLPTVPSVIPGFTDGGQLSRLGIRWYGFSPLWLDPEDPNLRFSDLFHGYNERVPEDGLHWGLERLFNVVHRFCAA
ncbi:MAG: M20/M25/M40 family metallo-hydrolase [Myxococcales bacterium]|nr:M20/M25/M40 family metallo-hydrolase [Myxococcales bacterium]